MRKERKKRKRKRKMEAYALKVWNAAQLQVPGYAAGIGRVGVVVEDDGEVGRRA
jgi:hypothetical protein